MTTSPKGLWALYVARFAEGMTQRQVGDIAGVDQATAGRWIRGEKVPTEAAVVAKLAQGFRRNPLEAFVAAGFLTIAEAGRGLEPESRHILEVLTEAVESQSLRNTKRVREREIVWQVALELHERDQAGEILGPKALQRAFDQARIDVGEEPLPFLVEDPERTIEALLSMAKIQKDIDSRTTLRADVEDLAPAAREVGKEPGLRKRRREHDESNEAAPDDPTGMEPI